MVCCDQVHLCELVEGFGESSSGPSTLVTVKTLCADADEQARCVRSLSTLASPEAAVGNPEI